MKIAFIGGGNMGEAMVGALLKKKLCRPADIVVSDISESRRDYLKKKYGIAVTSENREAIRNRNVVVLAVKPQNINEAMDELKGLFNPSQLILSIAAGIKINRIIRHMGHRRVIRAMPNTPAQIGLGMSGWTAFQEVTEKQKQLAKTILGAMGKEIYFDNEDDLDIVTAVSGSGPAYLFLFAESLIDGAVNLGLKRNDAEILVLQTIIGAAHLMTQLKKTPAELRRDVTSKGGTTERAIEVFEKNNIAGIVSKAVKAACQRAKELDEPKS